MEMLEESLSEPRGSSAAVAMQALLGGSAEYTAPPKSSPALDRAGNQHQFISHMTCFHPNLVVMFIGYQDVPSGPHAKFVSLRGNISTLEFEHFKL